MTAFKNILRHLLGAIEKTVKAALLDNTAIKYSDLIHSANHELIIQRQRALMISSRVRMTAVAFGVLTPLWTIIDISIFSWPLWGWLALLRGGATIAFYLVCLLFTPSHDLHAARRSLFLLLSVPVVFFIASHPALNGVNLSAAALSVSAGYAFLPFVMVAGLSVFPLTVQECAVFATPMLVVHIVAGLLGSRIFPFESYLGALWLLLLIAGVSAMASVSQLHAMMTVVAQASHDGLTGLLSRRIGDEILASQFQHAQRSNAPLALAFIDLDNFKKVNDQYGHEEGDRILREASKVITRSVRASDIVIRWGGEEFLILMPNTEREHARAALERIRATGFGSRPDGSAQTSSIGIAEQIADQAATPRRLVEIADRRMYEVKICGKNGLRHRG